MDPEQIERMPIYKLTRWHGRAVRYYTRKAEAERKRQERERQITDAVRRLPRR